MVLSVSFAFLVACQMFFSFGGGRPGRAASQSVSRPQSIPGELPDGFCGSYFWRGFSTVVEEVVKRCRISAGAIIDGSVVD